MKKGGEKAFFLCVDLYNLAIAACNNATQMY